MNKYQQALLNIERYLIKLNDEDKASQEWFDLWMIVQVALADQPEAIIEDGLVC